jgi:hypothetical protein
MTDDRYGKIHTDGSRSGGQPLNDSIEAKALALVNEVQADWNYQLGSLVFKRDRDIFSEALCRAIEQLEAFRQEVSDVVEGYLDGPPIERHLIIDTLRSLITPKPKPDPLVAVVYEVDNGPAWDSPEDYSNKIRAALEARGLEIRSKGQ